MSRFKARVNERSKANKSAPKTLYSLGISTTPTV